MGAAEPGEARQADALQMRIGIETLAEGALLRRQLVGFPKQFPHGIGHDGLLFAKGRWFSTEARGARRRVEFLRFALGVVLRVLRASAVKPLPTGVLRGFAAIGLDAIAIG